MWKPNVLTPRDLSSRDYEGLKAARGITGLSDDPKRKVGAVITRGGVVLGSSANCVPLGMAVEPELLSSDARRDWIAHAEQLAIVDAMFSAGKEYGWSTHLSHNRLNRATLFLTPCLPCGHCANLALSAGIRRFVVEVTHVSTHWVNGHIASLEMMKRFDVDLIVVAELEKWGPYVA